MFESDEFEVNSVCGGYGHCVELVFCCEVASFSVVLSSPVGVFPRCRGRVPCLTPIRCPAAGKCIEFTNEFESLKSLILHWTRGGSPFVFPIIGRLCLP